MAVPTRRRIVRVLLAFAVLIAVALLLRSHVDFSESDQWETDDPGSWPVGLGIGIGLMLLFVPFWISACGLPVVYGAVPGALLAFVAALVAAVVQARIGQALGGRGDIGDSRNARVKQLQDAVRRRPLLSLSGLRMVSGLQAAVGYGVGMTNVGLATNLASVAVAAAPRVVLYAIVGDALL